MQYLLYRSNVADAHFLMWSALPAYFTSVSFVIFILSFDIKKMGIVEKVANNTFYIYLVHFLVLRYLMSNKTTDAISQFLKVDKLRELLNSKNEKDISFFKVFLCSMGDQKSSNGLM